MEKLDMERIERDIFRDYCQDGLVDMMFGAYFLFIGLSCQMAQWRLSPSSRSCSLRRSCGD